LISEFNRRLCACLLVGALRLLAPQGADAQTNAQLLIRIDLSKFGWQRLPPRMTGEGTGRIGRLLEVDHKGRILVGYTSRDRQDLASRNNPTLAFHVLSFDSEGRNISSFELPTTRWYDNGLYLDAEDDVIVKANDVLRARPAESERKLGPDDWNVLRSCSITCEVVQSTDRRTLLLDDKAADPKLIYARVSKASLKILRECPEAPRYDMHSFDEAYAYYGGQPTPRTYGLYRWPFCEYTQVKEFPLSAGGRVIALNTKSLALVDHNGIQILTSSGERKFNWSMSKGDSAVNQVTASENGTSFALQIITFRGGSRAWDINGKIVARRIDVFDSETGKILASVPILKIDKDDRLEFRLSPGGSLLAIMVNGTLEIFKISK